MTSRSRAGLCALLLLALAGCDWAATDPVSITMDFEPITALNADGSCNIRYVARASGIGTAEWVRVVIRESGNVVEEYTGAGITEFWGQRTISAGEQQVSQPYDSPDRGANVQLDFVYRATGPERTVSAHPLCAAS